jgi:hypothetical protein
MENKVMKNYIALVGIVGIFAALIVFIERNPTPSDPTLVEVELVGIISPEDYCEKSVFHIYEVIKTKQRCRTLVQWQRGEIGDVYYVNASELQNYIHRVAPEDQATWEDVLEAHSPTMPVTSPKAVWEQIKIELPKDFPEVIELDILDPAGELNLGVSNATS